MESKHKHAVVELDINNPIHDTFLNEVPNFTKGTLGKDLLGFITNDPDRRLYKLLITISKSDVVFTGKKRRRGTLMPTNKHAKPCMSLYDRADVSCNSISIY